MLPSRVVYLFFLFKSYEEFDSRTELDFSSIGSQMFGWNFIRFYSNRWNVYEMLWDDDRESKQEEYKSESYNSTRSSLAFCFWYPIVPFIYPVNNIHNILPYDIVRYIASWPGMSRPM